MIYIVTWNVCIEEGGTIMIIIVSCISLFSSICTNSTLNSWRSMMALHHHFSFSSHVDDDDVVDDDDDDDDGDQHHSYIY